MKLNILDYAKEASRSAAEILLEKFQDNKNLKTWFKEKGALVTEADIESDKQIREVLLKSDLGAGILSEESILDVNGVSEYKWLIDPLCGTVPYSMGMPHWGVSISLLKNGNAHLGVLSLPVFEESIWNDDEGNVFRNNEKFNINPHFSNINNLTIGVEIDGGENWASLGKFLSQKLGQIGQINSFASAVYPAVHVLTGKLPGVIFFDIAPVHISGVVAIAQNLGVKCSNFNGEGIDLEKKNIKGLVLAWPSVHEELLQILN